MYDTFFIPPLWAGSSRPAWTYGFKVSQWIDPELHRLKPMPRSALPARANRRMSLVVKDHFGLSVQAVTFPAKLLTRSLDSNFAIF
jgi:hypothetical protein